MDEVIGAIMDARVKAIEAFIAKNKLTLEQVNEGYVLDFDVLPNGDEKVTLSKKDKIDETTITYKVGYGSDK